jgi:hypothetical protein
MISDTRLGESLVNRRAESETTTEYVSRPAGS